MGFFSKVWSSVKGAVKSIGKGIKKAAKSVGKFAGKLGVVGQIGLMFALPAIGGWLASGVGALAGSANPLLAGIGKVLTTAGKFGSTIGNAFKTVTNSILGFVKNVGGSFVNRVAGALGAEAPLISSAPTTVSEGFSQWMNGVADDVSNITSPFRATAEEITTDITSASEDSYEQFLERSGVEEPDLGDPLSIEFDKEFEIPDVDVLQADSPLNFEVDNRVSQELATRERAGLTGYMRNISEYAINKAKELPERALDVTASTLAGLPQSMIEESAGLGPKAPQVTNVQNVVPSFDFAPISMGYEAQGLGYGATPENRVIYKAAEAAPIGDFGFNSFRKFSSLGIS